MGTVATKLRALLELARASNLPTVWSNALVGTVAGMGGGIALDATKTLRQTLPLMLSMSLLYVGGMILNDAVDAKVDAKERPSRPIPSGRIPRGAAFILAATCLGGGLAMLAGECGMRPVPVILGTALVACITGYNLLHSKTAASVALMGACRGLLILTCAEAAAPGRGFARITLVLALALTFYTIGLSVVARGETQIPGTPKLIMRLIAAMCLLDGLFLWALGQPALILFAVACWGLTTLAHRRILGS